MTIVCEVDDKESRYPSSKAFAYFMPASPPEYKVP